MALQHADYRTLGRGIKAYFPVGIKKRLMQFLRFIW